MYLDQAKDSEFQAFKRPFAASHSSRTGTRQTKKITISNYVCLLFVLSQCDLCSPAWRFCTTCRLATKGLFNSWLHQASESRMEKLPYGIKRSFHIVMLTQLIHNPNFKARMLLYLLLHFVWPFNFNPPKKGYTLSV